MSGAASKSMISNSFASGSAVIALTLSLSACGVSNIIDNDEPAVSAGGGLSIPPGQDEVDNITAGGETAEQRNRREVITELKLLREELKRRSSKVQSNLSAAKAELARRQGAGEIDESKVKLTPAQIRDSQLDQLNALRAELERRKSGEAAKQQAITTALTENEVAYRSIDECLTRPNGDFRGVFANRPDLKQIVDEKDNQVYRNTDKSLLLLTSKGSCDVSFTGSNVENFTTGLVHILETQGGIVETKELAGLSVITVVHPRGNFRLASGRKVLGQGSGTNLYTTISAI